MPEVLLDAAGRPRSPATVPGFHAGRSPRNKGPALPGRPTHRGGDRRRHATRRQRASCGAAARAESWCCGARACGSTRPSPSARRTLIRGAARCSCAAARAVAAARSAWTTGPGSSFSHGSPRVLSGPSARCSALPPARFAAAPGRPAPPAANCATPPRAPAGHGALHRTGPPRARRRDGPRRRPADRHPATARPHQPRDHLDLPAGHRQHRDHRHRPRPPTADGPGRRNVPPLTASASLLVVVRCESPRRRASFPLCLKTTALNGGPTEPFRCLRSRRAMGCARRVGDATAVGEQAEAAA